MEPSIELNESLREAACLGNIHLAEKLLQTGASINSQNTVNGWTALHWACNREHKDIVRYLIENRADPSMKTFKGEVPSDLTSNEAILKLLPPKEGMTTSCRQSLLPIVPSYLQYPRFPYGDFTSSLKLESSSNTTNQLNDDCEMKQLLVKVRISDSVETDFVEVDVKEMTYSCLLNSCCEELEVSVEEVAKLRKLPNVLIRKDKDVLRLNNGQELELVFKKTTNNETESEQ